MEEQYTAQIPRIAAASLSPNPADINAPVLLSVEVVEETVVLTPAWFQTDEIYCGEV